MDLSTFGNNIKSERNRQNMTLDKLSESIGISRNFLWEIEAGRKAPALKTLYNISVVLSVSIDYLLGISGSRNINDSNQTSVDVFLDTMISKLSQKDKEFIIYTINGLKAYNEQ